MAFEEAFNISRLLTGIILTIVTILIIFGGLKRIARVTEVMVPVMAIFYLVIAFYVILTNITYIPAVFAIIFKSAFGMNQAVGGSIGAALMWGIKRGLFSNEAGMGSAPNAAATSNVTHPIKEGLVQTLGVFTDTILICSATAFIILLADFQAYPGLTGIQLLQKTLGSHVGSWGVPFLAISILLFAYSSVIGNYYYGQTNIEFLNPKKRWLFLYRIGVCIIVLIGSVAKLQLVWDIADLFMGLIVLLNLIAITLLSKKAFACLKDYIRQKKENRDPVFTITNREEYAGAECWQGPE